MTAFWDIVPCSLTEVDVSEVSPRMEAVCTPEMSSYLNETTWRYILEDCPFVLCVVVKINMNHPVHSQPIY
jgi:hypothetical protein